MAFSESGHSLFLCGTKDYLVMLGRSAPGQQFGAFRDESDSLRLTPDDQRWMIGKGAHERELAVKKWSMILLPAGTVYTFLRVLDKESRRALLITAPPPGKMVPLKAGELPRSEPVVMWDLQGMLDREKKRLSMLDESMVLTPVTKTPRIAASLMVVGGRSDWKSAAKDKDSLLILLEGAATINSEGNSRSVSGRPVWACTALANCPAKNSRS